MSPITGLHHVTAIAGSAAGNAAFYVHALGQRLVKRTVNFDAPDTWHLYYGDEVGAAGTVMTFFPFAGAPRGRLGAGQVTLTHYAAPTGSLPFWRDRLVAHGATLETAQETVFGERRAIFADPDGLRLALVEAEDPRAPWLAPGIPEDAALRGFHGVTLSLQDGAATARILTEAFGYVEAATEGAVTRYVVAPGPATVVDLHIDPELPAGREGAGSVHHVAFSVPDRAAQRDVRARMAALGLRVTEPIDRQYFRAIYARTPGGALFEVATEEPGFLCDEPRETLGAALKLPPRIEANRARIEAVLPPLDLDAPR